MGRTSLGCFVALAALWTFSVSAVAQDEEFTLGVALESPDFPNLNDDGVIEDQENPGATYDFTGNMTLTSTGITGEDGPQGWSCGIRNEGVEILAVTWSGTA